MSETDEIDLCLLYFLTWLYSKWDRDRVRKNKKGQLGQTSKLQLQLHLQLKPKVKVKVKLSYN